ncbi:hypothetical protein N7466_001787 [Penicillium verhagenii]|uniref:uncharacterized protein n=1 Tax=Penicillium verhagenii TaxID=1562060 RepID=UPI002544E520|nr:uncharacterized protein N7466_001787 [Penicillium verhagenii]KAJ5938653.1 hypothetical protein N7466_001787 [Penicillium verhagenii]
MFNPHDPRHNPPSTTPFRRQESHTSSSDSQKQQSHWVQDLPRRSLHKARSGLLALRSGFLRRPRQNMNIENAPAHHRELSSASTQEDLGFGVALYRTNVPWPPTDDEPSIDILMRAAAFHPLANIASAPEVQDFLTLGSHDPDAVFSDQAGMAFHASPTFNRSCDHIAHPQSSHETKAERNGDQEIDMEQETNVTLEAHSATSSTDWETISSSSICSTGGNEQRLHDAYDSQAEHAQGRTNSQHSQSIILNGGILTAQSNKEVKPIKLSGNLTLSKQPLVNKNKSVIRRVSGVSSQSSNASEGQGSSSIQSEALAATQERLLQQNSSASFADDSLSTSSLETGSLEVPIFFPGWHEAMMEQWASGSESHHELPASL